MLLCQNETYSDGKVFIYARVGRAQGLKEM